MENIIIAPYSDVEAKEEWLWRYRIPHKNITFLYGHSKSAVDALVAEIAACISTGRSLAADGMKRDAEKVIYQDFKEGQIGTAKASLDRQKADCSNIAYMHLDCKNVMECIQKLEKGIAEFQPDLVMLKNISKCIQKLEAGDIDIQNVTVKRFSLLMKGISDLSQQMPYPSLIKTDIETVYGIHEMVDRLLEEESV